MQGNEGIRFFTVPNLCQRWSLSRSKLYLMIESGELRSVKIGSSRRIPLEVVEQFESSLLEQGAI